MRFAGCMCYFIGGLAGGYAIWGDPDHFWLWTIANFLLCFAGRGLVTAGDES